MGPRTRSSAVMHRPAEDAVRFIRPSEYKSRRALPDLSRATIGSDNESDSGSRLDRGAMTHRTVV